MTAAELVNGSTQVELQRIIRELGEDRHAARIARALVGLWNVCGMHCVCVCV